MLEAKVSDPTLLARHPEVAQLYTLQYAARVSQRVLEQTRESPSRGRLDNALHELRLAVDEYVDRIGRGSDQTCRVEISRTWSVQQGAAVAEFLTAMANAVRSGT